MCACAQARARKDAMHESTRTEFLSTCKSSWASGLTGRKMDSLNQVPLEKCCPPAKGFAATPGPRGPGFVHSKSSI